MGRDTKEIIEQIIRSKLNDHLVAHINVRTSDPRCRVDIFIDETASEIVKACYTPQETPVDLNKSLEAFQKFLDDPEGEAFIDKWMEENKHKYSGPTVGEFIQSGFGFNQPSPTPPTTTEPDPDYKIEEQE